MPKKSIIITIISIIVGILTIISLTQGIFGIPPIKDWSFWNKGESKSDIELLFKPEFINEGQREEIDVKITIPDIREKNVTYLELARNNVKIDRENKNEQTKVASYIGWDDSYNSNYVFLYKKRDVGSRNELIATGKLNGCQNCFMGETFPYKFTFTINYKIGDGPITTRIIEKKVSIID